MGATERVGLLFVWWAVLTGPPGCSSTDSTSPDSGAPTTTTGGGPDAQPVLDGGGAPAIPPDGSALCPPGACNFQTGAGCSGSMTCAPSPVDGKTALCQASGPKAEGASCTGWTDQCAKGAICAGGACRKLCCARDWTGCPSDEHCLREFAVQIDGGVVNSGAFVCYPVNQCDALVPTSCASLMPGTTCQIADATGATACLPEGKGGPTEPCGPASPCKAGGACVNNACRRLCKAVVGGGEPSCPATEGTCTHFTRDPPGVGECSPTTG